MLPKNYTTIYYRRHKNTKISGVLVLVLVLVVNSGGSSRSSNNNSNSNSNNSEWCFWTSPILPIPIPTIPLTILCDIINRMMMMMSDDV